MTRWICVGLAACAPSGRCAAENDLDGFGRVETAHLVPCIQQLGGGDERLDFIGVAIRARRGCVGLDNLFDEPPEATCATWGGNLDEPRSCFDGLSTNWTSVTTFRLDFEDAFDLTGATGNRISVADCQDDEAETLDVDVLPAQVDVLSDDGALAEVTIDSDTISGVLLAEVCR